MRISPTLYLILVLFCSTFYSQDALSALAPLTWESAELIIPALSLDYGSYKLVFNSRMWDTSIADPNWTRKLPFSNDVFTYIKIKKSPLKVRETLKRDEYHRKNIV